MLEKHRQYDGDFKVSAVRLLESSDRPLVEVARGDRGYRGACFGGGGSRFGRKVGDVFVLQVVLKCCVSS